MQKIDLRKSIYFLAFGIGLISLVVAVQIAKADAWSWTSGTPTIVSNKEVAQGTQLEGTCEGTYKSAKQESNVEGTRNSQMPVTDCVIGEGANFKILHFFGQSMAIQFAGDKNAHLLAGVTCRYCSYLPSKDTFITLESRNDVGSGRVAIYKNFVQKLKSKKASDTNQTYYEFTQAQPDQVLSGYYSDEEYAGYAKHMQKSSNDKWLVVEFVGMGIYRVDMDTMQIVRFSDWRTDYWYAGPGIEFDITNDGQHVAVFGTNSINTIFDITLDCGTKMGYPLKSENMMVPQQVVCPFYALPGGADSTIVPHLTNTFQPKFSDDGGEISFYAVPHYSTGLPSRFVTLRAANYSASQQLDYLALGDSYSSGEGDVGKKSDGARYYLSGTNVNGDYRNGLPEEKCHVSSRSYPFLLRTLSGIGDSKMKSVACSGAIESDINGWSQSFSDKDYLGQYWEGKPRLAGISNIKQLQDDARSNFIPGRIQQIEFLKRNKPQTATVSVGGNDVLFGSILASCIKKTGVESVCDWAKSNKTDLKAPSLEHLGVMIEGQYNALRNMYSELKSASPTTKLYVVGYPQFVDSVSSVCPANFGLNKTERQMVTNGVSYMNNVIKAAAGAAGAYYVDIENSLSNHVLCGSDLTHPFVNGTATALVGTFVPSIYEQQEGYHPNADGHAAIFEKIKTGLEGKALQVSSACNQIIICPAQNQNGQPSIPEFFKPDSLTDKIVKAANFVGSVVNNLKSDIANVVKGQQINIRSPLYTFASGSSFSAQIHSNPIDLGTFKVNEDGSIDTSLVLPNNLEAGYHTLTFSGITFSGDPIMYTQIILVQGQNPNDIDEDGITDSSDRCLYVSASGIDKDMDGVDDACDPFIGDKPVTIPSPTPTTTTTPSPSPSPPPKPSTSDVIKNIVSVVVSVIKLLVSLIQKLFFKF